MKKFLLQYPKNLSICFWRNKERLVTLIHHFLRKRQLNKFISNLMIFVRPKSVSTRHYLALDKITVVLGFAWILNISNSILKILRDCEDSVNLFNRSPSHFINKFKLFNSPGTKPKTKVFVDKCCSNIYWHLDLR